MIINKGGPRRKNNQADQAPAAFNGSYPVPVANSTIMSQSMMMNNNEPLFSDQFNANSNINNHQNNNHIYYGANNGMQQPLATNNNMLYNQMPPSGQNVPFENQNYGFSKPQQQASQQYFSPAMPPQTNKLQSARHGYLNKYKILISKFLLTYKYPKL